MLDRSAPSCTLSHCNCLPTMSHCKKVPMWINHGTWLNL